MYFFWNSYKFFVFFQNLSNFSEFLITLCQYFFNQIILSSKTKFQDTRAVILSLDHRSFVICKNDNTHKTPDNEMKTVTIPRQRSPAEFPLVPFFFCSFSAYLSKLRPRNDIIFPVSALRDWLCLSFIRSAARNQQTKLVNNKSRDSLPSCRTFNTQPLQQRLIHHRRLQPWQARWTEFQIIINHHFDSINNH